MPQTQALPTLVTVTLAAPPVLGPILAAASLKASAPATAELAHLILLIQIVPAAPASLKAPKEPASAKPPQLPNLPSQPTNAIPPVPPMPNALAVLEPATSASSPQTPALAQITPAATAASSTTPHLKPVPQLAPPPPQSLTNAIPPVPPMHSVKAIWASPTLARGVTVVLPKIQLPKSALQPPTIHSLANALIFAFTILTGTSSTPPSSLNSSPEIKLSLPPSAPQTPLKSPKPAFQ